MQGISLHQLLGQTGRTAGSQVDNVGELAVLHGAGQDVLQVLVGGQLDLDAGLSLESCADVSPDLGAVSGLNGSDLDGLCFLLLGLGSVGVGAAAGSQGQSHDQSQQKCNDLLHKFFLHNQFCFVKT